MNRWVFCISSMRHSINSDCHYHSWSKHPNVKSRTSLYLYLWSLPNPQIPKLLIKRGTTFLDGAAVGKESACNAGDGGDGFDPWVGKSLGKRKWQPTPVFLHGKFYGQKSLVGYSPRGHKESDTYTKENSPPPNYLVFVTALFPHLPRIGSKMEKSNRFREWGWPFSKRKILGFCQSPSHQPTFPSSKKLEICCCYCWLPLDPRFPVLPWWDVGGGALSPPESGL